MGTINNMGMDTTMVTTGFGPPVTMDTLVAITVIFVEIKKDCRWETA